MDARQKFPNKNRYSIRGRYSSTSGTEFQLDVFYLRPGSLRVMAGGMPLEQGKDYQVNAELGTLRILNEALVMSGTPITVSVEDDATFGLQQKTLMGARFDYAANENLHIGATVMKLTEKPLTEKVNIGQEPMANTMLGADLSYSSPSRWLTRMVDKLPFISTKEESQVSFYGEFAKLVPGHPSGLNTELGSSGTTYIDDFEHSTSYIDITGRQAWQLSGTPRRFPESGLVDDLAYGYNRALLAFYNIDPVFYNNSPLTPRNMSANVLSDHRIREVWEEEIFPFRESRTGGPLLLNTLNLAFYPMVRGPYNYATTGFNSDGLFTGDSNRRTKKMTFASAGWQKVQFNFVKYEGQGIWGLAWKINSPKSQIAGYNVKVEVCPADRPELREDTCKPYGPMDSKRIYQPTGLLHDFGDENNERMYFGLLTGSYAKNIAGGVLRSNVDYFKKEINRLTGQFQTGSDVAGGGAGIVANINRLRLVGFNNTLGDESRYFGHPEKNYTGCPWIYNKPLSEFANPEFCDMWGNPIAEMMFETLRYFAGAEKGHPTYAYGSNSRDDALQLSKPDWQHPYRGRKAFPHCSRPVMTVFSDINPSFDFKLPGSHYQSIDPKISGNPLSGINVAQETQAIGAAEGIHGKQFFIGQSTAANADAAPTVKTINDLSYVRGLSPQEPSRQGTYYAAGVARFGARNQIAGNPMGMNPVMTYSVALASPLPEIRFPVGNGKYVTLAPFAKTIGSSSPSPAADDVGAGNLQATNQIVDFYVEKMANTGSADKDANVNGGRPYAKFRINYEDIEQGADHDMDMMVIYTIWMDDRGKLQVELDSSTQAFGWAIQHAGYVISGTTKDGVYMEVRDVDTPINDSRINKTYYTYRYNTPPGRDPGYCLNKPKQNKECKILPLVAKREFTPSSTGSQASFLKDPLWYAAKYGIPGRNPASVVGEPSNYFLVTNASTLKEQLTKAFNDILQASSSITAPAVDIPKGPLTGEADVYRTTFAVESGWSGDVIKDAWKPDPTPGENPTQTKLWSAAEKLTHNSHRKIFFASTSGLRNFTYTEVSSDSAWLNALNTNPENGEPDGRAKERIAFLRGENHIFRDRPLLVSGAPNILGDIVNSSPVLVQGADLEASVANRLQGNDKYNDFVKAQELVPDILYVGANDGMLHAFRADTGEEVFAFIPSELRRHLNKLTHPQYGESWGNGAHRYFVDGTPIVKDVYFGNAWHKVLIGSLGAGGRQIFALDVTDPVQPKLLWEFGRVQDKAMGHSLAQPTVARLNNRTDGKWVVLLPSGYDHEAGEHVASLFVLDISNGTVLRKFTMNGGAGLTEDEMPEAYLPLGNGLSRVVAIDHNDDGMEDVAYAGDLLGNLWRFDIKSKEPADWKVEKLFVAKDADGMRQSITAAPTMVEHPDGEGDLVIFATGRFLTYEDQNSWQTQTVYGIWDLGNSASTTAALDRSRLQAQEFEESINEDGVYLLTQNKVQWRNAQGEPEKWGWFVNFPQAGEKLLYNMYLYGKTLVIGTLRSGNATDSLDTCTAGIAGGLYGIDPETGGALDAPVFDRNDDGLFNDADLVDVELPNGSVGRRPPSGLPSGGGMSPAPAGGYLYPPGGVGQRIGLNPNVEYGRESWREQPPNSP